MVAVALLNLFFFSFSLPLCHCFPSNFQYFIDVHIFLFTSSSFFSENSGRTVNDENRWTDTPERAGGSKSARKMFGSIERGLDRVRLMLTPRRRQLQREMDPLSANSGGGPNIVSNKVGILFLFLIEKTTQVASWEKRRQETAGSHLRCVSRVNFQPKKLSKFLSFRLATCSTSLCP